jgi:hypothetical protein
VQMSVFSDAMVQRNQVIVDVILKHFEFGSALRDWKLQRAGWLLFVFFNQRLKIKTFC